MFAYACACQLIETDDIEPHFVEECQCIVDWAKQKDEIQVELDSLTKRMIFGPIVPITFGIKHVDINGSLLKTLMR